MNTQKAPQTAEEIFSYMKLMWESDNTHEETMARQMVGMVYELFDNPPKDMTEKEKRLLRYVNDLEAQVIRLESRGRAVHNGFMPMMLLATTFASSNPNEALKALGQFIDVLGNSDLDLQNHIQDSHKIVLDLRQELSAGYK